jgi:pilus assembly protein TadC
VRAAAALLAGLAVAVALGGPATAGHRLGLLRPVGPSVRRPLSPQVACLLAGVGLTALLGVPFGLGVGVAVAAGGPPALGRLEPAAVRQEREQLVAALPLALDLLAACLSGGASLPAAAAAVSRAVPPVLGRRFASVTDALAVGSPPAEAWLGLAGPRPDDPLTAAARVLARAAEGGMPVSAAVGRLAAEARAVARSAGAQAARRVGVTVVAPLGLCFLPAFVLLGIVPVVIGLAAPLLATF